MALVSAGVCHTAGVVEIASCLGRCCIQCQVVEHLEVSVEHHSLLVAINISIKLIVVDASVLKINMLFLKVCLFDDL